MARLNLNRVTRIAAVLTATVLFLLARSAFAQEETGEGAEPVGAGPGVLEPVPLTPPPAEEAPPPVVFPQPQNIHATDLPNDNGTGVALLFDKAAAENDRTYYTVSIALSAGGPFAEATSFGAAGNFKENFNKYYPGFYWFGRFRNPNTVHVAPITEIVTGVDEQGRPKHEPLTTGKTYYLKLAIEQDGETMELPQVFEAVPKQDWFNTALSNNFLFAVIFGAIILFFIARARRDPNLFIRKIAGLEAVDEAIGRATEMGKPILYLNGMSDLSSLSTIAALNILGRVSRRVANYESQLTVPCRDPVVLTVAQEIVKQGYADAGRPDAFNADSIFFLTSDQFSYAAAVSGIMMRDRPSANFFMGYYYAESLILAETGASTGAIQIAATDSATQLPFFITTCDYTLIGEELYASSAYLSREPLLLGSLKGQDMGKAFMMIVLLVCTILLTCGVVFVKELFRALG